MPSLLFGQPYWGECSREKMTEILVRMDSIPWRRVLAEAAPHGSFRESLTGFIGPDFVYGMPWGEIDTALDVGSGLGLMTALLAQRAKTVISLERVPERALFQRKRAAQDGVTNWHPLIAAADALPFPPETFDLITLSGVFGSLGQSGGASPKEAQRRFLERALHLLKPGGYLYVGTETRFGKGALLGRRDHSRLAANTHTPNQYKRLFTQAGFGRVEVFGVFDAYDRQTAVYPLSDAGARRATRNFINPPASWKSWLLSRIETAGSLSGSIEDEVVIFGRKTDKAGPLIWPGLPHDGTVAQFSSSDKVFALCFGKGPVTVFKGPKTETAVASLSHEHEFLQAASRRHGAAVETWPLRWPKPLGKHDLEGRAFYRYEFADGRPLAAELLPISFNHARFSRHFSRLVESYVALCDTLTAAPGDGCAELLDSLAAVPIGDEECSKAIQAACAGLRSKKWQTRLTHGDLSLTNTMLLPDQSMVLVDWENAGAGGLVAIDLIRLEYDVRAESERLKPAQRGAVLESSKRTVGQALARLGVGPEDHAALEALFVAHQFRLWLSREPDAGSSAKGLELLRKYRDRG